MSTLAITGVPSTYRAPIMAAEIKFAQGPSSAGAGERYAIAIGPRSAAGTATSNKVYVIGNEGRAIELFGPGSPLHRLIRAYLNANRSNRLYAASYAATSGGSPLASTATITFATAPTASGNILLTICEEVISLSFTTSSTVTTIAADAVAKINGLTHLPLTASNSAGVITLTSKIAGTSQNGIYRIAAEIDPGKGTTVATSAATLTSGAEGTTTENANLTALLNTLTSARYYYMGFTNIATADFTTIRSHIGNKSSPIPGLRSVGIVGAVGTLSAAQTLAIAQNNERVQLVWQKNSPHDPAQLVGQVMAIRQKQEQVDPAFNFDNYAEGDWFIKPAADAADWPSSTDVDDAVTDGVTPVGSNQTRSFLVMSVNTRSKNDAGTLDDFRASETHRISVMDRFTDEVLTNFSLRYSKFKLKDDERLADGSVNPNQVLGAGVAVPSTVKTYYFGFIDAFADANWFQRRDDWKESTLVQIDPQNNGRVQIGSAGRVIDLFHQATFRLSETTPN